MEPAYKSELHCTLNERVQDEYELDWGSNMQTKAIWIVEDESKVGGEMPS